MRFATLRLLVVALVVLPHLRSIHLHRAAQLHGLTAPGGGIEVQAPAMLDGDTHVATRGRLARSLTLGQRPDHTQALLFLVQMHHGRAGQRVERFAAAPRPATVACQAADLAPLDPSCRSAGGGARPEPALPGPPVPSPGLNPPSEPHPAAHDPRRTGARSAPRGRRRCVKFGRSTELLQPQDEIPSHAMRVRKSCEHSHLGSGSKLAIDPREVEVLTRALNI